MSLSKFISLLLDTISDSAGRQLAESISDVPASSWFAELPPEADRAQLQKAAAGIGELLASGAGEIPPRQLAKAIDLWHTMHGTSYCPPLLAALESLG